ncbi:tricarboxylate transporter [Acuticoccus sp. M5D2P5]|uniref:Bug family tripartite tricarboxylate transporter substrate binding protein n=1 Tax=Acuticoccus kalidii TaxID=2910977 RepID=UPI001F31898D|nr:tripartite tricarboxylate transporter substrate-binding protein [Acuticoccus kalidii]MCF3935567.1 tricarboxylate transporter [Acuticoccus kalidii]
MTRYTPKATALTAALSLTASIAMAGTAAADFSLEGEQIEVIVPYSPGGAADAYGRFISAQLGKFLPGSPTVIVRNAPGAGAIAGTNGFQQDADPDGLTLLVTSTSTLMNALLEDPRVKYDLSTMTPVVVNPLGMMVYGHESLGIEDVGGLADLGGDTPLRSGAHTPTSADLVQLIEFHILGLDVTPIFGLQRADAKQAFERGEISISYDNPLSYNTYVAPMVESGIAMPLYAMGYVDSSGERVRDPAFPDLPTFPEAAETVLGEAPSGPAYDAWQTMFFSRVMASKAVLLPEGTPDEIVAAYQAAAEEMAQDPEFIAETEKMFGGYPTLTGAEAKDRWLAALKFDDEARAWLYGWLEESFGVSR